MTKRLTDKEYEFIFSRVPRLCLDFIIVKDGEVLFAKRDIEPSKGQWSLPGGMVRYKESVDEAAERILQDEVGLRPQGKKLLGYVEYPDEINKNGIHVHSVSMVFLATLEKGGVLGNAEAREINFFKSLPEGVNLEQSRFLKNNWKNIIG